MSGNSSVGNAAVYEAGDQRNPSASEKENQPERYEEGKENSHKENDSSESEGRISQPSLAISAFLLPCADRHTQRMSAA